MCIMINRMQFNSRTGINIQNKKKFVTYQIKSITNIHVIQIAKCVSMFLSIISIDVLEIIDTSYQSVYGGASLDLMNKL